MPALKCLVQIAVQDVDSDLQQEMGAALGPAHLLFLDEPFGDDLIDRRLHEAGRNAFATAIPFTVVDDSVGIPGDISIKFTERTR